MNGQQLEEADAFKYLDTTLTKDGRSTTETKIRMASATSAMAKHSKIWKSKEISFPAKMKLYKSLVLSILLYGCESWTMTAKTTKRIQMFETKCFRQMLGISWRDRKSNDFVKNQVTALAGPQEPLLALVKKRKLSWFGHVTRRNSLPKTILQGTLEGGRRRERQTKCWLDNIKEWTRMNSPTLIRRAEDRAGWWWLMARSALMSPLCPRQAGE